MYEKQEWIDRIKDEHGNIIVEGTPYNKRRMDHIEQGIEDAHKLVEDMEITPEGIGAAPAEHTHTSEDVGAAPAEHIHTHEDVGAAPAYTYGTEDMAAGTSTLETGKLYFVYE